MDTKTCAVCGKTYKPRRESQQTCSRECRSVAHRKKVQLTCQHCGKQFEVAQCYARLKYCSRPCYWAHGGAGPNTPNSKRRAIYGEVPGRKRVYVGHDSEGKLRYIQRSHAIWNETHPDDPVLDGEEVHHKDRNPGNDAIENLQKMTVSDHHRMHINTLNREERSRRAQKGQQTMRLMRQENK